MNFFFIVYTRYRGQLTPQINLVLYAMYILGEVAIFVLYGIASAFYQLINAWIRPRCDMGT